MGLGVIKVVGGGKCVIPFLGSVDLGGCAKWLRFCVRKIFVRCIASLRQCWNHYAKMGIMEGVHSRCTDVIVTILGLVLGRSSLGEYFRVCGLGSVKVGE